MFRLLVLFMMSHPSQRSGRLSLLPAIVLLALAAGVIGWLAFAQPDAEPVTMLQIRRWINEKEFDQARVHLADRLEESPADRELTLLMLQVCQSLGDNVAAMDCAAAFPDSDSGDYAEIMLRAALIAMQDSWPDRCEEYLNAAIEASPRDPMPHRVLVRLYHMLRNRPALQQQIARMDRLRVAVARDALMFDPGGEIGWDDDSYVNWLEVAHRNNPDNLFVLASLARALPRLDRPQERTALLDAAASATDRCWTLALEVALDHLRDQRPGAALSVLSRTEPEAELSAEVWITRATALRQQQADEAAIRCLENARQLAPNDPASLEPLLQLYERGQQKDKAHQLRELRAPLDRYRLLVKYFFESNGKSAEYAELSQLLAAFGQLRAAQLCLGTTPLPAWVKAAESDPAVQSLQPPSLSQLVAVDVSGYLRDETVAKVSTGPVALDGIHLADVAAAAGLDFAFQNIAQTSDVLIKSLGGGVGVLDFDNDDWPDLFFAQGDTDAAAASSSEYPDRLWRNLRGAQFVPVETTSAATSPGYSHGVSAADFDNDGFTDVLVCRFGQNRLLQNNGDGTFTDISDRLPPAPLWSTSAAFADVDGDSDLDVYVSSYVDADLSEQLACNERRGLACTLRDFTSQVDVLLINDGDGQFTDASTGVRQSAAGSGLGVISLDYDADGRPDFFVGNDTTPNALLQNASADTGPAFADVAVAVGVAVGSSGRPQACMGISCADVDGNGWLDLLVTNFQNQPNSLYLNNGGLFEEAGDRFDLANASRSMLSWGSQFCDVNGDAWPDLVVANGHLYDRPMPVQLFINDNGRRFLQVSDSMSAVPAAVRHGRSLAMLDWNRDGRSDFVISNIGERASLLENRSNGAGTLLRLVGTRSSRTAEGTLVWLETADGRQVLQRGSTGGGFFCTNDNVVLLPPGAKIVRVVWPQGQTTEAPELLSGEQVSILVEPSG